jgi:hypothetical protein
MWCRQTFDEFKTRHGKTYQNSLEEGRRMEVYRQNMRYIHSKNRSDTLSAQYLGTITG